jgi:hypothetical protein
MFKESGGAKTWLGLSHAGAMPTLMSPLDNHIVI